MTKFNSWFFIKKFWNFWQNFLNKIGKRTFLKIWNIVKKRKFPFKPLYIFTNKFSKSFTLLELSRHFLNKQINQKESFIRDNIVKKFNVVHMLLTKNATYSVIFGEIHLNTVSLLFSPFLTGSFDECKFRKSFSFAWLCELWHLKY